MKIPNFVYEKLVTEDGNVNDSWGFWFSQLIQELQNNVGNFGFKPTPYTTTEIAELDLTKTKGSIVYNITTEQFMKNRDGLGFVNF